MKVRWVGTRGTQAVFQLEPFALPIYLGTMRLASGPVDMNLRGTSGVPGVLLLFAQEELGEQEEEIDFSK